MPSTDGRRRVQETRLLDRGRGWAGWMLWILTLSWLPSAVHGGCLTVQRHADTGEVRFGRDGVDNFCHFAKACFAQDCPLADFADWPLDTGNLEEDLPPQACERVRLKACSVAYRRAEEDCAGDPLARRIWDGVERGFCVRCQRLVEAYRRLQARCPLRDRWRESLQSMLSEFVTVEPQSESGTSEQADASLADGCRSSMAAEF
mmetsp:Transcript_24445/g.72927  ORF Transcript_24445/g.72927 Transcript_24445/m.72927 type:complete len:204 (-) Transcript_24445:36-647(-)